MDEITDDAQDLEAEARAEARWQTLFAQSSPILEALAQEAHGEYLAGLAEDFDPDNDPDLVEPL